MRTLLISILVMIGLPTSIVFGQDTTLQSQELIDISWYRLKADWLGQFDLDGDKKNDWIDFNFSGGAHCCYKIIIRLSSDNIERAYPFKMDGGYVGGVNNTNPEQFDIRDIDNDGLPEILMEIQTYNGDAYMIPKKWQLKYGIKTNHIVIEYDRNNKCLIVRDYKK